MDDDNTRATTTSTTSTSISMVEAHPQHPLYYFNLGKHLWESGEREKAGEHLLMAAKLDPQNGQAFTYLGHYYTSHANDTQRALKCYQRAVSLDPNDSLAGVAMCDLLDKQGKESLQVALCKDASARSPRAFWAFSRLGFLLLHQSNWSEAVQSLQHAIRGYPTCADLWEALGLAYQRLGMYTAAIKSYGRAMELEDSRAFAMIESGNIFLMLGSYTKGIEQFRHALEICPCSASANYGLASGLLAMSKESINQGAFTWAISLLEEASVIAKLNSTLAGNMSCVWKLYADIQFTYANYFPWTDRGYMKDEEAFSQSLLSWKRNRYSAALSSRSAYQRALHLAPWQANIYVDVAVVSDLIYSLEGCHEGDLTSWQLPEKMVLGSLSLEGDNYEFWMSLGCFSSHKALRQHAFIRGLQLDVSLASAWAHLGKLYRERGQNQLARQAFDRARSIDPSLALPWAGMSADIFTKEPSSDEAYDSCLRAVQIMHIAEFQIGLAKLALRCGHLSSPEVFAAIMQAVQCAPSYPESHNLNGLVYEARHDYESAVSSYRLACCALKNSTLTLAPHLADVSVNLARALCKAGNAQDGVVELEDLKERGMLDVEGLQVYAISLWMLGKNDMALSAVENLTECVLTTNRSSSAASISLICTLLYRIAGSAAAINSVLRIPRELLLSTKVRFLLSALNCVNEDNQLQSVVPSSHFSVSSHQDIEMHLLIALTELVRHGSKHSLNLQIGITHLSKALHMYPNGTSIRNMLGYMLLSREHYQNSHVVRRCCVLTPSESSIAEELKSAQEIIGAEAVACHAFASCKSDRSFSACNYQSSQGASSLIIMQRWLHLEPWNHDAKYLLILNLLQRAREARYPQQHINVLKQMTYAALNSQGYTKDNKIDKYKRFQLLLCASEISLHGGDMKYCVSYAKDASNILLPNFYTYFAHLQLCRAYAAEDNHTSLTEEFKQCLKLKTNIPVGWISLKLIESCYKPKNGIYATDSGFEEMMVKESKESWNSWMPVYKLFSGLIAHWAQDSSNAERLLAEACSSVDVGSSFFLCHGGVCMELAKQHPGSQYLSMAIRSLMKARELSSNSLPLVSLLLAQAEAGLGSKIKWENNLHLEWSSWTPEERPAEVYFQMHLILKHGSQAAMYHQQAQHLLLRAIHLNPSSSRYWKTLYF